MNQVGWFKFHRIVADKLVNDEKALRVFVWLNLHSSNEVNMTERVVGETLGYAKTTLRCVLSRIAAAGGISIKKEKRGHTIFVQTHVNTTEIHNGPKSDHQTDHQTDRSRTIAQVFLISIEARIRITRIGKK